MLVHRRVPSPSIHFYTWVERGTVHIKCLSLKHNTVSTARARTRTAQSGGDRTNHEASAPLRGGAAERESLFLASFVGWNFLNIHREERDKSCWKDTVRQKTRPEFQGETYPWVFPFVRHRNHIFVMQIFPFWVPSIKTVTRRARHVRIAFKPFINHVVIKLFAP